MNPQVKVSFADNQVTTTYTAGNAVLIVKQDTKYNTSIITMQHMYGRFQAVKAACSPQEASYIMSNFLNNELKEAHGALKCCDGAELF